MRILGAPPRYKNLEEAPKRGSGCLLRLFKVLLLGLLLISAALLFVLREDPEFIARNTRQALMRVMGIAQSKVMYVEHVMPVDDKLFIPALSDGARGPLVDETKIAALFRRKKFKQIEQFFADQVAHFERDRSLDEPLFSVFDALLSIDPEALDIADAWLKESPDSLVAQFLRAQQTYEIGSRVRSIKAEAGSLRMWLMRVPMHRAGQQAEAILARHPTFLPAIVLLMRIANVVRDDQAWEKWRARGAIVAPNSVRFHRAALAALLPRWGGSYAQMETYVSALQPAAVTHPELRPLAGYADADRAEQFTHEGTADYPKALALYDRALSHGETSELLSERGDTYRRAKNFDAARKDLDRAFELNPFTDVLSKRLYLLLRQEDQLEAARVALTLLRLDPYAVAATSNFQWLVDAAVHVGVEHYHAGRFSEALEAYRIAEALAPFDRKYGEYVAAVWVELAKGDSAALKARERAVALDPNDFDAHVVLGFALYQAGRAREMIGRWDSYIARHPDDLRAYHERARCFLSMKQKEKAAPDFVHACEEGFLKSCGSLQSVGLTPPKRPGRDGDGFMLGF